MSTPHRTPTPHRAPTPTPTPSPTPTEHAPSAARSAPPAHSPSHRAPVPARIGHGHGSDGGPAPGPLTGLGRLCRFIVRRDRVRMSVWTLSIAAFVAYFSVALSTVFDEAALAARAEVMRTPAGIVMGGPGYGLDHYTPMVAVANEGTLWLAAAMSLMAILHVVRHTRAEEESGRAELVRAGAVGRHAPAVATLLTLAVQLAAITVLGALATFAAAEDRSLPDALALTGGTALVALAMGAVALVAGQLAATARGARGLALAALGVAVVVRSAGDMIRLEGSALSWLSPIAWAQQMRAYVDLRWWPMLLPLVLAVLLLLAADALAARRDLGQGILPQRPGRAEASAGLRGPLALAWRQQRGALAWCAVGLGLMWFATGTLMSPLEDMAADLVTSNGAIAALFGPDPARMTAAFLGVMMLFIALGAAVYGITAVGRCRGEESAGTLELTLAGPVGRSRWLGAQAVLGLGGTAGLLVLSVLALWLGMVSVGVAEPDLGDHTAALLTQLPPTLAFGALALALYGWAPRLTGLAWLLVAAAVLVGMFGAMLDLPEAVLGISPFHWAPDPYLEEVGASEAAGPLALAAVDAALVALALLGFRRRAVVTGS